MSLWSLARIAILALTFAAAGAGPAVGAEWFVSPGGVGTGTASFPFGRIQDAINAARPGDIVTVAPGTYAEALSTVRAGVVGAPITVRATKARTALVTRAGRVLTVGHPYMVFDGFVFDGQYGRDDTVRVTGNGDFLLLRNAEVRRSTYDLIDLADPQGVVVDHCLIHRALNAEDKRTDAHGIVAGAVRDLTIRDTEIHTFSGDALQLDPGRAAPGWSNVTLERDTLWLAPLASAENGFAAGVVPGENGVDTKASASFARAALTIRDTVAYGFKGGLIGNMAAFNLKEHVDVTVDGVTVYDSELAFRLRGAATGGAWVAVKNAVIHDVLTAFRYEDNLQNLRVWNTTLGRNVTRAFQNASSPRSTIEVRNLLTLGTLPGEAPPRSNLRVTAASFVDATRHDYHLTAGSPAIDTGDAVAQVQVDRDRVARPQGRTHDIGAYEWSTARPAAAELPPQARIR